MLEVFGSQMQKGVCRARAAICMTVSLTQALGREYFAISAESSGWVRLSLVASETGGWLKVAKDNRRVRRD